MLVDFRAGDLAAIAGVDRTVIDGVRDYHDFARSLGPLRTVRTDGDRGVRREPEVHLTSVLASEGDRVLLGDTRADGGEALLLADGLPIENALIGEADNAAFGLAAARATGRTTTGRVRRRCARLRRTHAGSRALPDRWKVALFVLGVAADRVRLGPGPPPRTARSADARPAARAVASTSTRMATTLERTARLRRRARAARRRGRASGSSDRRGLPADADRGTVEAAARAARCSRTTRSWHCGDAPAS